MVKPKKFIEKKEIKVSKILTGISNIPNGESITPTALAKKIGIHYSTLIEKLDEYELSKKVGWRNIRDNKGKARLILKTDEDLIVRNELRDIKKEILTIKSILDEIKSKKK